MSRVDITLGLNQAGFERGLERARGTVANFKRSVGKFPAAGRLLGGAAAIGLTTAAVGKLVSRVERLEAISRRLNVGMGFVQELERLAQLTPGVDVDNLVEFLQDVNEKAFDAAAGGGEAAEAFKMLGLEAEKILALPLEAQFRAVADAIANAEDKQMAIAATMKIGSDEATKLLPLLRQGSDGIAAMTAGMRKFGDEGVAELVAVRRELAALRDEAANAGADFFGGAALGLRATGRFFAALVTGKDPDEAFFQTYQKRIDEARQKQIGRQREEADRRERQQEQAAARRREAEEKQRKEWEKKRGEFPEMEDPRKLYAELAETVAEEARDERRKALEDRRGRLADEESERGRMVAALRREVEAQRPAMDSLTRIGLGAGGVNYALERPRGEELLRKQIRATEAVKAAIEEIELTLEEDEFGS